MKMPLLIMTIVFAVSGCKNAVQTPPQINNDAATVVPDSQKVLQTIAFGSCNRETLPQPMWEHIQSNDPDLWIWLGDIIYGDTEDMAIMKKKYDKQLSNTAYQKFKNATPVIGIWDDHDYGVNDGGKNYGPKDQSKQLLLDFLGVPETAPQRKRDGAYASYTYGTPGKTIKIILLDGRWFRDDIEKVDGVYQANNEGTLLGEAQWSWLEEELKNSDAQVHIIACGIQMIPEDHRFEKWANFPSERKRLLNLLESERPAGLLLISGDRHIGEFSRYTAEGSDFPIFEITTSGLTHSYESVGNEPNRHRIDDLTNLKNFGLLQIDWEKNPPALTVELRGEDNVIYASEKLTAR